MRKRAEIIHKILEKRFETVLPMAMHKTGYDMWIVVCQEDDLDPAFKTLIPITHRVLYFKYWSSTTGDSEELNASTFQEPTCAVYMIGRIEDRNRGNNGPF